MKDQGPYLRPVIQVIIVDVDVSGSPSNAKSAQRGLPIVNAKHRRDIDESLRIELQEAIGTFRHWTSLMTQAFGFIIAGNVLLLSYGFSQERAVIFLLASAFPVGILLVYLLVVFVTTPLGRIALKIEQQLGMQKDSLAATYVRTHLRPYDRALRDIEKPDDEDVVRNLGFYLDKVLSNRWWLVKESKELWLVKTIPVMTYAGTLAQVALFLLSLMIFHYPFMSSVPK